MEQEMTLAEALAELEKAYGDTIKTIDELHQKKIDLIAAYKKREDEENLRAARASLLS
jgi:hypothetical protein